MNEEANRKLLEFAGFYQYGSLWTIEDEDILLIEPPNFFHPELGLGWLFKYVEPKLWQEHKIKVILCRYDDGLYQATLVKGYAGHSEQNKEPQVALANAILKWLEREKK